MIDWRQTLIPPEMSIREAIGRIDRASTQIALVVDSPGRLLGTLTDGDVRRGLLRGIALEQPVREVMNPNPTVVKEGQGPGFAHHLMHAKKLHHMPIVDAGGVVVGLESVDDLQESPKRDNLVVVMAGGLGTRLRPLTDAVPKPMLRVGGKPILETILGSLIESGFRRFCFTLNYKADVVRDYFGNGSNWGADISYVTERERLGTAGALSLLPDAPTKPILVMNGDLLTGVDFGQVIDFHVAHKAFATVCVREFEFTIPFGVVDLKDYRIESITEKPMHRRFVSAGVYVLEPAAVAMVPRDTLFDMPMLLERLLAEKREVAAFPIIEYWRDIGRVDDLQAAHAEFGSKHDQG